TIRQWRCRVWRGRLRRGVAARARQPIERKDQTAREACEREGYEAPPCSAHGSIPIITLCRRPAACLRRFRRPSRSAPSTTTLERKKREVFTSVRPAMMQPPDVGAASSFAPFDDEDFFGALLFLDGLGSSSAPRRSASGSSSSDDAV